MEPLPAAELPCPVDGVRILRLDWSDASPEGDRLWRTWITLSNEMDRLRYGPDSNLWDADTLRGQLPEWTTRFAHYLALEGDRAVGIASLGQSTQDDSHEAALWDLVVRPEDRGRGIGRALHALCEEQARAWGCTEMTLHTAEREPGESARDRACAQAAGYRAYQEVVNSVLPLPMPDAFHAAARAVAERGTPGYTVETSIGTPPTEWFADVAALQERMSVDAPPGDRPAHPQTWTVDRVADWFRQATARGDTFALAVARHEDSGRLVGFTYTNWEPATPWVVHQGDTLVMAEHRAHGLGRAMKVAAIGALVPLCAGARLHRTCNAAENGPMLRVNEGLGYVRDCAYTSWTRDL